MATFSRIVRSPRWRVARAFSGADAIFSFNWEGSLQWKTAIGDERPGRHRNGSGSNPSPATDGQGIYVYVTLNLGVEPTEDLRTELRNWVRKDIGPFAAPDQIQWAPGLPKTRSGKIMRRILRKIAANDYADLGDTSTLADPGVVDDLVDNRRNR